MVRDEVLGPQGAVRGSPKLQRRLGTPSRPAIARRIRRAESVTDSSSRAQRGMTRLFCCRRSLSPSLAFPCAIPSSASRDCLRDRRRHPAGSFIAGPSADGRRRDGITRFDSRELRAPRAGDWARDARRPRARRAQLHRGLPRAAAHHGTWRRPSPPGLSLIHI